MAEEDIADFTLEDEKVVLDTDEGLAKQDLSRINLDDLNVDTFEVMSRQATINVGTIGHVAHGKSTVVKALSGVKTQKFHREAVMNITIHLGYANAKVYQCASCPRPSCFQTYPSSQPDQTPCPNCGEPMMLKRHFSFVDCPGHDVLMATMLNGAAIMDSALLLIAANESFPQPQTLEHLKAVEIMKLRHLIVIQNKIDLVKKDTAQDQYVQIRSFLDNIALNVPVVPVSAQLKRNVDYLLEYLLHIPLPQRQLKAPVLMTVVRSFDINKPGEEDIENLRGGVAGGTVMRGVIKLGQTVEIRPGLVRSRSSNEQGSRFTYSPLKTRTVSLKAERNPLQYAIPGGLIAVGTTLDPTLTRQDKMVGHMLGEEGTLPEVYCEIEVQYYLFTEVVGAKATAGKSVAKRVQKLNVLESLQINVGTLTAGATVLSITQDPEIAKLELVTPVCCTIGEQVAISRMVDKTFRLIGWGTIRRGVPMKPSS